MKHSRTTPRQQRETPCRAHGSPSIASFPPPIAGLVSRPDAEVLSPAADGPATCLLVWTGVFFVCPDKSDLVVFVESSLQRAILAVRMAKKVARSGAGDLISTTTESSTASSPCMTPAGCRHTSPGPMMNSSAPTVDLTWPLTT